MSADFPNFKDLTKDIVTSNMIYLDHNTLLSNTKKNEYTQESKCNGSTAQVFNTILDDNNLKIECALKIVNRMSSNEKKKSPFSFEVFALCHMKNLHPCIVEIYGWNNYDQAFIVMELIKNGSLSNYISKQVLSPTQKTIISLGIAHAMAFIHYMGIVHLDLSWNNILLDENLEPKIIDFGFSDFAYKNKTSNGTPGFIAPDWFHENHGSPGNDVFSFGTLLFALSTNGELPTFDMHSTIEGKESINFDDMKDVNIRHLTRACRTHPLTRFSFEDVVKIIVSGIGMFKGTVKEEVIAYYQRLEENTIYDNEFRERFKDHVIIPP